MARDPLKMRKDLLRWAFRRASRDELPYNITLNDIHIPDKCPVLGIPLFKGKGSSCENSPTLDRIFPEMGYVPGNVIVVSQRANRLKSDASWHELQMITEFYEQYITKHWLRNQPK